MQRIIKMLLVFILIAVAFPITKNQTVAYADSSFHKDDYIVYSRSERISKSLSRSGYLVFRTTDNTFYLFKDNLLNENHFTLRHGTYTGSLEDQVILYFDDDQSTLTLVSEKKYLRVPSDNKGAYSQDENGYHYNEALKLLEKYLENAKRLDAYEELLSKKYSIVEFGSYEQDNNLDNGPEPIKWIVLENSGGFSLLTSLYILDFQRFNDNRITNEIALWKRWGGSTIRDWLNTTFLNVAFSPEEQQYIPETSLYLRYPRVSKSAAITEETVLDKVFLLSKDQVEQFFTPELYGASKTKAANGVFATTKNGYYKWLTLSEAKMTDWYCVLDDDFGTVKDIDNVGIRPVIRVVTNKLLITNQAFVG